MLLKHTIPPAFVQRVIRITVVGAGGTGSALLPSLARLHLALVALGHVGGLQVTVMDPDEVSSANIGRQQFYPGDEGYNKADLLVHRINMTFGLTWQAQAKRVNASAKHDADVVIGCVDNRKARLAIVKSFADATYYLDCGNNLNDGQVILGELGIKRHDSLPHVGDLFPELIDPALDATDTTPSCSMADSLRKQSLVINQAIAVQAFNLLWTMFRKGKLSYSGVFVNLDSGTTQSLKISPDHWARFGYIAPPPPKDKAPKKSKVKIGQS